MDRPKRRHSGWKVRRGPQAIRPRIARPAESTHGVSLCLRSPGSPPGTFAVRLEGSGQLSPRHNNFILCELWKRLKSRIPLESEVVKAFTAYERDAQRRRIKGWNHNWFRWRGSAYSGVLKTSKLLIPPNNSERSNTLSNSFWTAFPFFLSGGAPCIFFGLQRVPTCLHKMPTSWQSAVT